MYAYISQTELAQRRTVDLLDFRNTIASEAKWCLDCLGWHGWLGCLAWLSWLGWLGLGQWGAELDAKNQFGVLCRDSMFKIILIYLYMCAYTNAY